MHRITTKRLMAFIVSLGACLALAGSPALFSAQGPAVKASARTINSPSAASVAQLAAAAKAPAAPTAAKPKSGSAHKRTKGGGGTTSVSGTATDASGHGWPLYVKIEFTSDSTEALDVFSDPTTGQYQATLFNGIEYAVTATPVQKGYIPQATAFTTDGTPIVQDFPLEIDAVGCTALGYAYPPSTLFANFETGAIPAGWSQDNFSGGGSWHFPLVSDACGEVNNTGGDGGFAIIDSDCDGLVQDDVALNTPSLDLSAVESPILQFNSDYQDLESVADVDVSTDGGATWTNVWERAGADDRGPTLQSVDLTALASGQADVRARFHFQGFWAWWWEIDNVLMGDPDGTCNPTAGGLLIGNVLDGNSGSGLNGATVSNLSTSATTKTFDPGDPNRPTGFYYMFAPAGPSSLEATQTNYAPDAHSATVFNNDAVRSDFTLEAGMVSAAPSPVTAVIPTNGLSIQTLTLTNTGEPTANFELIEINAPLLTNNTKGFASPQARHQALSRLQKGPGRPDLARSAANLRPLTGALAGRRLNATGDVIASYPTNIPGGWGVLASGASFWLSNIQGLGGDEHDWQYSSSDGTQTGANIDNSGWVGAGGFTADGTYDTLTGMMWQVNVGGDNCIYELDPTAQVATGNKICGSPWTGTSQRGLAYDPINNGFFIGGWNEGIIYHIDINGNVLDSASVALPISGMAYAASTGHLLVMSNTDSGQDITVFDALNNYAVLGTITVMDGGSPAFGPFEQAGLEFDCLGNLWAVNQITQVVYNVDSGESAGCAVDIPWLTEDPTSGAIPGVGAAAAGGNSVPIAVTFNSTGLMPGLRQAQLQVKTDTPYQVPGVPVALTVLFNDVPQDSFAWNFIYGIAGAGIMFGGPPTCPAGVFNFCPNGVVTRADMAGYIFRAMHGPTTPPPVYANIYGDVTFNQYNAFYIQGITNDGITAGCGNGNYCPDAQNTRAQMSVFIYKGQNGDVPPPACTDEGAVFADVPCGSFAADYIYGLYNEGVTAGCGGGNFCPNANITNAQMSVFLVKGFNIPYLP